MYITCLAKILIYRYKKFNKILKDYLTYPNHIIFIPMFQNLLSIPLIINQVYYVLNYDVPFYAYLCEVLCNSLKGVAFSIIFITLPEINNIKNNYCNLKEILQFKCLRKNVYFKKIKSFESDKFLENKINNDDLINNLTLNVV